MTKPVLEVQNVSATFTDRQGSLRVLKDLSFSVNEGEFLCVLGPSGSGKSTLLRILAGLVKSNSGTIVIKERSLQGPQAGIGLVFQDANLMPWRTVLENIALPLEVRNHSDGALSRAEQMVNLVGLHGFEHALPRDLSGGMAQRVAIARALVQDPDILLLDEPFGALDALTKGSMQLEVLKLWNLNNREKTIVMITHDIEEALFLSDRIVVLNNGPASTIREIVEVHLPRPRNKIEIVKMPEYIELRDKLLHLLTDKFSIEDMGMVYKS